VLTRATLRALQGILERMKEIELEMQRTQKNKARRASRGPTSPGRLDKGSRADSAPLRLRARRARRHAQATSYHLGRLKAQLAKLRTQLLEPAPGAANAKTGDGFEVTKYGHARVGASRRGDGAALAGGCVRALLARQSCARGRVRRQCACASAAWRVALTRCVAAAQRSSASPPWASRRC
jgi:hypothetical protein